MYFVGIDIGGGSSAETNMNVWANEGGVPKPGSPGENAFYNSFDGPQLQTVMEDVIDSVLTCTVTVGSEPAFPEFTKVIIDGTEYAEVTNCATQSGWAWTNQYDEITFCGAACDDFKAIKDADIQYFCSPG